MKLGQHLPHHPGSRDWSMGHTSGQGGPWGLAPPPWPRGRNMLGSSLNKKVTRALGGANGITWNNRHGILLRGKSQIQKKYVYHAAICFKKLHIHIFVFALTISGRIYKKRVTGVSGPSQDTKWVSDNKHGS